MSNGAHLNGVIHDRKKATVQPCRKEVPYRARDLCGSLPWPLCGAATSGERRGRRNRWPRRSSRSQNKSESEGRDQGRPASSDAARALAGPTGAKLFIQSFASSAPRRKATPGRVKVRALTRHGPYHVLLRFAFGTAPPASGRLTYGRANYTAVTGTRES